MSGTPTAAGKRGRTEVLSSLTDGRRRRIVRTIHERAVTMTERELAAVLVDDAESTPSTDGAGDEVERRQVRLRHVDLPALESAGLLSWDRETATVTTTDHPVLESPQYELLVETEDDRVAEAIANDQRRALLASFDAPGETVTRSELVEDVADDGTGDDAREAARIQLHHVHLPMLQAAELVDYDADEGTVTYCGSQELLESVLTDEGIFETTDVDETSPPIQIP